MHGVAYSRLFGQVGVPPEHPRPLCSPSMTTPYTNSTARALRRSSSASPDKARGKPGLGRVSSICVTTTSRAPPPSSPSGDLDAKDLPRYMWDTTNSIVNTVTKPSLDATTKEKPMYFTSGHSVKKEDTHVIAKLLAQLAEKEERLLQQAAAIESKDALISQFTNTCDRLKHDCEVLAEKAFDWKQKYDDLLSATQSTAFEAASQAGLLDAVEMAELPPPVPEPISRRRSRKKSLH
ncbi:Aste57867_1569 [Aphanomyces stellatus]|uniref:Aste57867_1569 protein n=1 Tax=Aphanomyces stellatus TaxID=120398 RepID=A0A485K5K8_9STRA|nr:hypothetical protein As57867_001568 [Aphanomyces stellatus]VFT78782.1 Aste57867_1569 [Aphanomyces stellatus]